MNMKLEFFIQGSLDEHLILGSSAIANDLNKWNLPSNEIRNIINFCFGKYKSTNRHYHNLRHIFAILINAFTLRAEIENLSLIRIAALFHDVIYDTKRSDNEAKSAQLAIDYLRNHLPEKELNLLKEIILSTTKHQPTIEHPDCALFLDMDLAILAADWETYQIYANAIRKEYAQYSDDDYKIGRQVVMNNFLTRKQIFFTDLFFEEFEKKARKNIKREIKNLTENLA